MDGFSYHLSKKNPGQTLIDPKAPSLHENDSEFGAKEAHSILSRVLICSYFRC